MGKLGIRKNNLDMVKEELDYALSDCYDAPMRIVVKTVLGVLDNAEKEKRLNPNERKSAMDYISECYGYNF